jgi:peptidyl-tRNA hydrolase, PTH1 family
MKLIAGLGNPGTQYAQTRHNAGFRVVTAMAASRKWEWVRRRERALIARGDEDGQAIVLVQPQTYMNESGQAVGALTRFFKLPLADILIICDDLDLPLGRVRLRERGSSGGQRGVASILTHLGSQEVARLRIGIGRPAHPGMEVIDHVLGIPSQEDREILAAAEDRAADAAWLWAREGPIAVMNRYNSE